MEKLIDDLSERTEVASNVVKFLRRSFSEIEHRQRNVDLARESVVERMMEIETLRESYEKGLKDLEEKERGFCEFKEGKKRKLASGNDELSVRREELLNDVRVREEKMEEQLSGFREKIDRLEDGQKNMHLRVGVKLREMETQEVRLDSAWDSLAQRERKVDGIVRTMYGQVRLLEERENEFNLCVERKMREIGLKEEELSLKWQVFLKEVKLADERFMEKEKLMERLEMAESKLDIMWAVIDENFKEIEAQGSAVCESVAEKAKRADLIVESMEKELEELEQMKGKILNSQEFEMGLTEIASKEQGLKEMIEVHIEGAELREEQLTKRLELGNQLLERLKLAHDNVVHLKNTVCDKFKEVDLKEIEVKSIGDWVERKMVEVDSKGVELERKEESLLAKEENLISEKISLEKRLKELELKEENLQSWQTDLDSKEKTLQSFQTELRSKKKNLRSWEKKLKFKRGEVDSVKELNERWLEELDRKEKSLNSVKKFTSDCFKEHIAMKKQLLVEKDLVQKRARDLGLNESVDLKFILRMNGKTLQTFLNDPKKDLDGLGDEIFQVLHLSSDPPKLVLDAMVGFYPPHLREGDVEVDVRRTCIILLEQLIKTTNKIKPCVRKEAIELARSWKSKMRAGGEDPLEVLGFLHLLAAYNLASCFDKNQILGFLKIVDQLRKVPLSLRIFGFEDSLTDSTGVSRSI